MNIDDKIVGSCLFGYIKGESKNELNRCLDVINDKYGPAMKKIVLGYLKKYK